MTSAKLKTARLPGPVTELVTSPIHDSRPFAEVLRDWLDRHGLSNPRAAAILGAKRHITIRSWLDGAPVTYERAIRALMTMIDEGRV